MKQTDCSRVRVRPVWSSDDISDCVLTVRFGPKAILMTESDSPYLYHISVRGACPPTYLPPLWLRL